MGDAAVDDVGGAAPLEGAERRQHLGDHPAADRARGDEAPCPCRVELADQRAVGVVDAVDVGEQQELRGAQRHRELGGDGVRVDVVRLPVVAEPDGGDHRDPPLVEDRLDRLGVHLGDVADEAEVLAGLGGARAHQQGRPVLAAQPDRAPAEPVDAGDELRAHLAGEHHLGDLHRLRVGDPQPVDEARLHAHPLLPGADLRPATVDEHRAQPDEAQQHDVLQHRFGIATLDGGAAQLHHHGLTRESADEGQRLDQHLGAANAFVHGLGGHRQLR